VIATRPAPSLVVWSEPTRGPQRYPLHDIRDASSCRIERIEIGESGTGGLLACASAQFSEPCAEMLLNRLTQPPSPCCGRSTGEAPAASTAPEGTTDGSLSRAAVSAPRLSQSASYQSACSTALSACSRHIGVRTCVSPISSKNVVDSRRTAVDSATHIHPVL
jgi:hypothetical protein